MEIEVKKGKRLSDNKDAWEVRIDGARVMVTLVDPTDAIAELEKQVKETKPDGNN